MLFWPLEIYSPLITVKKTRKRLNLSPVMPCQQRFWTTNKSLLFYSEVCHLYKHSLTEKATCQNQSSSCTITPLCRHTLLCMQRFSKK